MKRIAFLLLFTTHSWMTQLWGSTTAKPDPLNPFYDLVRLQPCVELVPQFKEFCLEMIQRQPQDPQWPKALETPLETLRDYVQHYIKRHNFHKLVVDCCHTERGVVCSASDGLTLATKTETHLHADALTITKEYRAIVGGVVHYWGATTQPTLLVIGEEKPSTLTSLNIELSETFPSLMRADFIRDYPLGPGSDDLPLNHFEEIYFENCVLHDGIDATLLSALGLVYQNLKPQGKLVFDFAGKIHITSVDAQEANPHSQDPSWKEELYEIVDFARNLFFSGKNRELSTAGCETNYETGQTTLRLDPKKHDLSFLKKQATTWVSRSWFPPIEHVPYDLTEEGASPLLPLKWHHHPLTESNLSYLQSLWKIQAWYQFALLQRAGFVGYQLFCDITNPRNLRHHSLLIEAIKPTKPSDKLSH